MTLQIIYDGLIEARQEPRFAVQGAKLSAALRMEAEEQEEPEPELEEAA